MALSVAAAAQKPGLFCAANFPGLDRRFGRMRAGMRFPARQFTPLMKAIGPLLSATSPAKTGPRRRYRIDVNLGPLRAHMRADHMEMCVQVADRMISRGISQNHAAVLLGLAPSKLHVWRRRYHEGGIEALIPRTGGRTRTKRRRATETPYRLEILLTNP